MPKLNRWLITSIIDDIKELITVGDEMCSWIGKVDYLSWRFPTKCAKNVNAIAIIQQQKGSAGEMYILLLEMAYDRMQFVLRLVLEFLDGYPLIEEFFNDQLAKSKRPKNMSAANVIQILWQRLKLLPETITRNVIKTRHLESSVLDGRKSRGCQVSGSLSYCENCSKAAKAIKDFSNIVITALRENKLSSVILAEREIIRSDIFEKTQWDVMTKLVDAVDKDLKTLLDRTSVIKSRSETRAEEYEKSVYGIKSELEKEGLEKIALKIKIEELTDRMKSVDDQLQRLKSKHVEKVEENQTLIDDLYKTEEKLSDLEILLAVSIQQVTEITEIKIALESTVENLNQKSAEADKVFINETERLKKSLQDLEDEKILLKNQHLEEVENLKENHVAEMLEKFYEYVKISGLSKIDNNSTSDCIKIKKTSNEVEISKNLLPKGDPEIDMTQQFIANKKTIEKLSQQNERLSKTLTRLIEYRKVSRIIKMNDDQIFKE